jgi:hypothetical protein
MCLGICWDDRNHRIEHGRDLHDSAWVLGNVIPWNLLVTLLPCNCTNITAAPVPRISSGAPEFFNIFDFIFVIEVLQTITTSAIHWHYITVLASNMQGIHFQKTINSSKNEKNVYLWLEWLAVSSMILIFGSRNWLNSASERSRLSLGTPSLYICWGYATCLSGRHIANRFLNRNFLKESL